MLDFLRSQADPAGFPAVADALRSRFLLHHRGGWNPYGTPDPEKRAAELAQLAETPALAQVLVFHGDGFLREAAVHALSGPIRLPVVAYGLLERLNDWSAEVRLAAEAAFARWFPATPPAILVPALWIVLLNGARWRRWQGGYDRLVAATLDDDALTLALLDQLSTQAAGGSGPIYQALARDPRFDRHLPRIASAATHPMLRARATDSLSTGRVHWPLGTSRKVWIDKSLGRYRLAPDFGTRPLSMAAAPLPVLTLALQDRAAVVRRTALDGLIAHRHDPRLRPQINACLASASDTDRPSIQARRDYLRTALDTPA
ncbi:MAG: hypothetical protein KBF78_17295 [Fuscovulum sp.]|nr:hypothetical protein [Fuscovulum sp.]